MSLTPSNMMELGTEAPDFSLPDVVTKSQQTLAGIRGDQGTLVMFICNHCPYVIHVQDEIAKLGADYLEKGIGVVAISSNDVVNYPDDAPALMKDRAIELGFRFPYLYDASQEVARAYDAACTPDFFLFDRADKLAYRGRLDDSRPGNDIPVTGRDLRDAIDRLIAGRDQQSNQYPSMGCNIKWRN